MSEDLNDSWSDLTVTSNYDVNLASGESHRMERGPLNSCAVLNAVEPYAEYLEVVHGAHTAALSRFNLRPILPECLFENVINVPVASIDLRYAV